MAELSYVCAYFNWLEAAETLNDSERGRLYTALIKYAMTGEVEEFKGNEKFVFHALKWTIDRDKKAYEDKCNKNQENGKRATATDRYQSLPIATDRYRPLPIAPKEKEKEKEEEKQKEKEYLYLPSVDIEGARKVAESYNSICSSFPKLEKITSKRVNAAIELLKAYDYDSITEGFKKAQKSSFLKGGKGKKWKATFDWLTDVDNFAKVLEGNYDDEQQSAETEDSFASSWAIIEQELAEMNGETA